MTISKKLSLGTAAKISKPATPAEPARILEDETKTVGPAAPPLPISAVPGGHWAGITAAKLAEDFEFGEDVTEAVVAGETSKRRVYTVLWDLKRIFTDEELASFPQLTPKLKDLKPSETNLFIDEYPTQKKNKDGKDVAGTGSRYNDLGNSLPWIKEWADYKAYLVEAKKDRTKAKPEQVGWSSARFDTEIRMYGDRARDGIAMIKTAMRVFFQMSEINTYPQVGCALMTYAMNDAQGAVMIGANSEPMRDLVSSSDPLTLFARTEVDPDTNQPLSCSLSSSAFLALKPRECADKAGGKDKVTYAMLLASAGRVTSDATVTTEPAIKNLDNLEGVTAEWVRFMIQDQNAAAFRAKLAGKDKKGNPLMADDYLVSLQDMFIILEGVVTLPEFQARIRQAMANARERDLRARGITPQSAANTKVA